MLTALKVLFAAYLTFDFIRHIRKPRTRRLYQSFLGWGAWRLTKAALITIPVLLVVVAAATLLISAWPEVMGWSWLQLLAQPGEKEQGGNLIVSGAIRFPLFGLLFLVLFLINVPRLARYEEDQFRRGTKGWKQGALRSLHFGLVHCLIGVPIGAGLALGIGGLWFTYQYFKGGVRRSTMYHSVYNMILLVLLFVFLAGQLG
jgi:hypothetical protein